MSAPPHRPVGVPVPGDPAVQDRVLHVLHLGFEDPLMPGAGGGSVRTHQINRRLAADGFRVTVLTTTFPGAEERVQDGVRYVPVGAGQGRNRLTRLLGYVALLPFEARRRRGGSRSAGSRARRARSRCCCSSPAAGLRARRCCSQA